TRPRRAGRARAWRRRARLELLVLAREQGDGRRRVAPRDPRGPGTPARAVVGGLRPASQAARGRATVECVTATSSTGARLAASRRSDPLRFFSAEQVARARSYHVPLYWSAAVELTLATSF